jgi:hypothetical protein
MIRVAARGLSRLPGPSRRGHDAWVPLTGVNGIEFCYEGHGTGIGPDGVLAVQRRDAVAGAFTVALQLTGAVHCNKFQ